MEGEGEVPPPAAGAVPAAGHRGKASHRLLLRRSCKAVSSRLRPARSLFKWPAAAALLKELTTLSDLPVRGTLRSRTPVPRNLSIDLRVHL